MPGLSEPPPKGEIAVLVAPPDPLAQGRSDADVEGRLRVALQTLSVKDAAAKVAAETGRKRRDLYARALALAGSGQEPAYRQESSQGGDGDAAQKS